MVVLGSLVACDTWNPGAGGVEFTARVSGEVAQHRENEDGWGWVNLTFRQAPELDIDSVQVTFLDLPPGVVAEYRDRGRSPYISGTSWIGYYLKGSPETPLGEHRIVVQASAGGRTYATGLEIEVVPRRPSLRLDRFSVSARYRDYPSLYVYIENTYDRDMSGVEVWSSCKEDTYGSLTTSFRGNAPNLPVGEITSVTLNYERGFPYFTSYPVRCNFFARFEGYSFDVTSD